MKNKRKFAIKVFDGLITKYIKNLYITKLGIYYETSLNIENAKIWVYKKNAKKIIKELEKGNIKPTFNNYIKINHKYKLIETTPQNTLRKIKLKKLKT